MGGVSIGGFKIGLNLKPGDGDALDPAGEAERRDARPAAELEHAQAASGTQVRLGGGDQVYRLKSEPGASGELYSDGVLAFHTKGEEGLVYWVATNDLIGRGCKAP